MTTPARVLIVDDEPINLMLLESLLEDDYEVLSAQDATEALALLASSGPVDLVLSDVLMPDVDGYELCRHIKAQPAWQDLPVLLITSLQGEQAEVACFECGASDMIGKPYSPELVQARVRTHVQWLQMRRALQAHGLLDDAAQA